MVSRLLLCSSASFMLLEGLFKLLLEGLLIDGLLGTSFTPCNLCLSSLWASGVSKSSSEDAALVDLLGVEDPDTWPEGEACARSSSK